MYEYEYSSEDTPLLSGKLQACREDTGLQGSSLLVSSLLDPFGLGLALSLPS